jgi:hypothetical protein
VSFNALYAILKEAGELGEGTGDQLHDGLLVVPDRIYGSAADGGGALGLPEIRKIQNRETRP